MTDNDWTDYDNLPTKLAINASVHLGVRPLCPCCGGGEYRKGYKRTKAKSIKMTLKSLKSKPRHKDHRGGH